MPDIDIDEVRTFIGRAMVDELQRAEGAGHGFVSSYTRNPPPNWAGWVMLDLTDNVRPSYDISFVEHWSPERVITRLYAQARLVAATTDLDALLVIAQDYAQHPYADRLGWKPEWKRDIPHYLHRELSEFIYALAGKSEDAK